MSDPTMSARTPGMWMVMHDGPLGDGKPWKAGMEAAPGLTIGSPENTELIARFSGYLQPVQANVEYCLRAVNAYDADRALIAALTSALKACVEVVKLWHGPEVFDIYYAHSPEMKPIREALSRAEKSDG